eukprot:2789005-Ditylum_brightwellii.AAC.1
MKERSTTRQFIYSQRIPLPKQVRHTFATPSNGDDIFHGLKYPVCKDGSWMMHKEHAIDMGDNYCPEERLLDASIMAKHNMMPLGPARILERIPEGPARGMKRDCHGSNDDTISIASRNNSAAAHQQMNAQPTAVLTPLQQRALQEQAMCHAMQQQQAL